MFIRLFGTHFTGVVPLPRRASRKSRATRRVCPGRPLTPAGYAILAATLAAVALAGVFSALAANSELDTPIRLFGGCS